ncbi:hypothetical protein HYU23_02575 [Candidatus Woesearchaeota archaeon]|nr:hypothetical protein [Candidatus Woesearchaeota archaeon]
MQKRLSKKGISPLIATVLLIGATVGVFIIVFSLIRGVTVGTIEKSTTCGAQEETSLDIAASFACSQDDSTVDVSVSNNGQTKVEGYMFVFYKGNEGKSVPPTLNPTKPGEQSMNKIKIDDPADCPDRIEVYPGIVKETGDKAKFLVCKDKKIEVKL